MRRRKTEPDWTEQTLPVAEPDVEFLEEEWNQPGSDTRGHSAKLSFRVPPQVARCVEAIIASGRFPYQTADDLLRHACVRHLHALLSYDRTVPRTLYAAASAVLRLAQDHENQILMREAVSKAAAMIAELYEEGDLAEVKRKVAFVDAIIAQMPESSPWRRRFESAWRRRSQKYRGLDTDTSPAGTCPSSLPEEAVL